MRVRTAVVVVSVLLVGVQLLLLSKQTPPPRDCSLEPQPCPSCLHAESKPEVVPRPLGSGKTRLGVVIPVMPRKDAQGDPLSYWETLVEALPREAQVLVYSRVPGVEHPHVDEVLEAPAVHPSLLDDILGRPLLQNHGDSPEHVRWRATMVLDFALSMGRASEIFEFVLWLEDDAVVPSFLLEDLEASMAYDEEDWWIHHLSRTGAVAVLFKGKHLPALVSFMRHRFDSDPIDWLMDQFGNSQYAVKRGLCQLGTLPLVGHRGKSSSLDGNHMREMYGAAQSSFKHVARGCRH